MAVAPLFVPDMDTLLLKLRLGNLPTGSDARQLVDECVREVRTGLYRYLKLERINEILAFDRDDNPTTDQEMIRSLAETTEVKMVKGCALRALTFMATDGGADSLQAWNEEGAFRDYDADRIERELKRLSREIQENMEILAEEEIIGGELRSHAASLGPDTSAGDENTQCLPFGLSGGTDFGSFGAYVHALRSRVSPLQSDELFIFDPITNTSFKVKFGAFSSEAQAYENPVGETLSPGQLVFLNNSGNLRTVASGEESAFRVAGVVVEGAEPGFNAKWQADGPVTLDDWTLFIGSATLVPGATYYLSSTSGMATTTPPSAAGHHVIKVGVAVSPLTLDLEISSSVRLSA